jgi:hypothetical protein
MDAIAIVDVEDRNGLAAAGTAVCGVSDAGVPLAAKRGGQARQLNVAMLAVPTILLLSLLWLFDPAKISVPVCTFHALTGLNCPGCGATRATHELLHGRLLAAWHYNALWVLSLPLAVYLTISELRVLSGGRPLPGDLPRRTWFWLAVAAVTMVFFLCRNLP